MEALIGLPLPWIIDERLMYDIDHLLARLLGIILRDGAGRRGHLQVPPHIVAVLAHRRRTILVHHLRELRLLLLLLLLVTALPLHVVSVPAMRLLILVFGRANV